MSSGLYRQLKPTIARLADDVGELNGRLDGFVNVERTANLFNPARLLTGYYYAPDTSGEKPYDIKPVENSAFVCTYIDVEYGKDYIASGIGFNAYTADSNGKAVGIAKQSSSNTPNAILDSTAVNGNYGNANTATRIYISWRPSVYPLNTFMVVEGTTLPSEYIPYGEKGILSENITVYESQIAKKEYHVDVNGGGDYTSFSACLLALKDDTSPKTIYVHGGVYDVFEELGGAEAHTAFTDHTKWADYSVFVPENTTIKGIGRVILEYLPETSETNIEASKSISPVNVQGTCHIENIEVRVKNGRYCVHDEINKGFIGSKKSYKNVRMIHYRNDTGYGYSQAYANGFSLDNEFDFEDCYFENADIYTFSFHNANMTATYAGSDVINHSSKISVKNCVFMTGGYATPVRFGNNSPYLQHVKVKFDNCYFVPYGAKTGILIFNEYNNEDLVNAFDVELNGCSAISPSITATNNQYTIKQFNGIASQMPVITSS